MKAQNPVLPGFNPDPNLLCVGEDYYIATSTFEWFPGVCIHHSRDLVNWEILSYALTDDQAVDMTGMDAACGIWAPNLTYDGGKFYLAFTLVYTNRQRYKDTCNFLTTAADPRGPWSNPVAMNCSGFDPSVFHDTDGRKYFVNMTIDHRVDHIRFSGIDVQEMDPESFRLLGKPVRVFAGTRLGTTEGPNILRRGAYYYLTVAEGGTRYEHAATVARATSVWGPYEESPYNPVLTSSGHADCPLQRAGHAQIAQGADGRWYMSHLCSRPVDRFSILGRESAIQNVVWTEDGWFRLQANNQALPELFFDAPAWEQRRDHSQYADFSLAPPPLDYMTLRQSRESCGIRWEPGRLVIRGGYSPMSKYRQGLLARRQQSLRCSLETQMFFAPRHLNHIAGLLVYYNYDNHYYLKMLSEESGPVLYVSALVNQELTDYGPYPLPEGTASVRLRAELNKRELHFSYALEDGAWRQAGPVLDMMVISDEHVRGNGFTGSMLGVNCCDCQGDGVEAAFSYLDYREYP